MVNVAIVGFGNVGRAVYDSVCASDDIKVIAVVDKLAEKGSLSVPIYSDISEINDVQAAILCLPSRLVPDIAEALLKRGICTVDCYDIHSGIIELKKRLDAAAKSGGAACITAAGWDPGTDSVIRVLFEAMSPKGITDINFGPGMSMGHSVAAKAIKGVKDALSMTIPMGGSVHRRMVYVQLEEGAKIDEVTGLIKSDSYFSHDETHVIPVDNIDVLKDMGHGVNIKRKGVSGKTHNQNFSFSMSINNPALTAQVLVSCARAVLRQAAGCYTLIEIPPIDLLAGERENIIKTMV